MTGGISERVPCPLCGEEIAAQAIKCRHCRRFIRGPRAETPPSTGEQVAGEQVTGEQAAGEQATGEQPPASDPAPPADPGRVPCKHCGEDISARAIKCKHCGLFLDRPPGARASRRASGPAGSRRPAHAAAGGGGGIPRRLFACLLIVLLGGGCLVVGLIAYAGVQLSAISRAEDYDDRAYWAQPDNGGPSWNEAARLYGLAADAWADIEDLEEQAGSLEQQGWCYRQDPDGALLDEAALAYAQAAAVYARLGDPSQQADALAEQAWCLRPTDDPDRGWEESLAVYSQLARLCERTGQSEGQARALDSMAFCWRVDQNPGGDWTQAAHFYGQAAAAWGQAQDVGEQVGSLAQQAYCLQPNLRAEETGSWEASIAIYARAADLAQAEGLTDTEAAARFDQAFCTLPAHNPEGDWEHAAELFARAGRGYQLDGQVAEAARSFYQQGAALCAHGERELSPESRAAFLRARQLAESAEGTADDVLDGVASYLEE